MATLPEKVATLEERTKDLPSKIAILEARSKEPHGTLWTTVVGVILTAVAGGLGFWGWYVTTNIVAIKQQLADGGNKSLVAQLASPTSSQQLQANLSTVVAQVRTARAAGNPPNTAKVSALSKAVAKAVTENPTSVEGWQAASELVSYSSERRASVSEGLPVCMAGATIQPSSTSLVDGVATINLYFSGCKLALDHLTSYEWTAFPFHAAKDASPPRYVLLNIVLDRGVVSYSGGDLTSKISSFVARDCLFEFDLPNQVPPPGAQKLVLAALLSAPQTLDYKG